MHNSYFFIIMVIMWDECLLSQQGRWLVVEESWGRGGIRCQEGQNHPEKVKEGREERRKSVTGKTLCALIIFCLKAPNFHIFLATLIFTRWSETGGMGCGCLKKCNKKQFTPLPCDSPGFSISTLQ